MEPYYRPSAELTSIFPFFDIHPLACHAHPCARAGGPPHATQVGRVALFGSSDALTQRAIDISPWAGVSGYSGVGWYWRVRSGPHGVDGAPSAFQVGENFQLARGQFIVLAVAYPPAAKFRVFLRNSWWQRTYADLPMAASLAAVTARTEDILADPARFNCTDKDWASFCEYTGGVGPAWFFDGKHLYLRLVAPGCYNKNQKENCASAFFEVSAFCSPTAFPVAPPFARVWV